MTPLIQPRIGKRAALAAQAKVSGNNVTVPLTVTQRALALQYRPFAVKIAKEYGAGQDLLELISEAYIGLCIAASRFDPERGLKFPTYAVFWIRAMILSYLLANHAPVRIGTTRDERKVFFGLAKAVRAVGLEHEHDFELIAKTLDVQVEVVERIRMRLVRNDLQMGFEGHKNNAHHGRLADDKRMELADQKASAEYTVMEESEQSYDRERIRFAMTALSERQRAVIVARYLSEEPKTLQVIGDEMGLSRERIRQIEGIALAKLKKRLERSK